MPFFKNLQNYKSVLIADGQTYVFNLAGKCMYEKCGLLPELTDNALRVTVVSVLNSSNNREIAVSWCGADRKERFRVYKMRDDKDYFSAVTSIQQGLPQVIRILNRSGAVENVRFNQSFFVLPDTITADNLQGLLTEYVGTVLVDK